MTFVLFQEAYCDFCCNGKISWTKKNHIFSCKKLCEGLRISESNDSQGWFDLCINISNQKFSIYEYCDDNFEGFNNKIMCKLDSCRNCCAVSDIILNSNFTDKSMQNCFEKCAQTFVHDPKI